MLEYARYEGTDLFPRHVVSGELDLAHATCAQRFSKGVVAENPALAAPRSAIASTILAPVVAAAGMVPSIRIGRCRSAGCTRRRGRRNVVSLRRHRNRSLTGGGG